MFFEGIECDENVQKTNLQSKIVLFCIRFSVPVRPAVIFLKNTKLSTVHIYVILNLLNFLFVKNQRFWS